MKKRIFLLPFLMVLCLLFHGGAAKASQFHAKAQSGQLDLREYFEGSVPLNGEWEFYPGRLLAPSEITPELAPEYIQVPGPWKQPAGIGTYRLRIRLPQEAIGAEKALSLYYIGSAYRVWIDGEEYRGIGEAGEDSGQHVPRLQRNLLFFQPEREWTELVLQVSNFSFRDGGILHEIVLGEPRAVIQSLLITILPSFFLVGGFLILGVYHIVTFVFRKNEWAIFCIGLGSLAMAVRSLVVEEFVMELYFPMLGWPALLRIEYLSGLTVFSALVFMLKLMYPAEMPRGVAFGIQGGLVVLAVFVLVAPVFLSTTVYPYFIAVLLALALYLIFRVGVLAVRRNKDAAKIHIACGCVIAAAGVNDAGVAMFSLYSHNLFPLSYFIFLLLQAIVLSRRYVFLFREKTQLAHKLLELNQTLEVKVQERTLKLAEKNRELEEAQRAKTMLLANIAHDIGAPLAGIQTYLQMIKDTGKQADFQEMLELVLDRLEYTRKLNNDFFELSKLESRALPFDMREVRVIDWFDGMLRSLREEYGFNGNMILRGQVETVCNGGEVTVMMDPVRIRQIIQNYMENALKYNKSAEKRVTLHCRVHPPSADHPDRGEIVVTVEDNGTGMDEHELPHVFDRFYRQANADAPGSGIGLAIVREIVEQHGGTVGATSQKGIGSRFYFTLPIRSTGGTLAPGS